MVAVARSRSELVTEVRRFIHEPDSSNSGWDDAEIIDWLNRSLRRREMQLYNTAENYGFAIYDLNMEADQPFYEIPTQGVRLKRVLRRDTTNGLYYTLDREEQIDKVTQDNTNGPLVDTSLYIPTYRVLNNSIELTPPPPADITNGLRIEVEEAGSLLTTDASTLPDSFPFYVEDLLVYDTVKGLYAAEGSLASEEQDSEWQLLRTIAQEYELAWQEYIRNKTFSQTRADGWTLDPDW